MEQPLPLLQRREGAVLVLSNNNPAARNALSPAFYAALTEALAQAEADPTVGAIVLTGEGGHFCAGGDFLGFGHGLLQLRLHHLLLHGLGGIVLGRLHLLLNFLLRLHHVG
jgi:enoyl-CoA hydratase/carnithine racemase